MQFLEVVLTILSHYELLSDVWVQEIAQVVIPGISESEYLFGIILLVLHSPIIII